MIIAPLIFSSLVAGIAGAGHVSVVRADGLKAILYFEVVTTLALVIGLVAGDVTQPGAGLDLPAGVPEISAKAQTWDQILLHIVPTSIIQAMAENDVLRS
jgi:Na+/H+-dicarboxylate symporter